MLQVQRPVLRQEQRLKMTPQLYQAIKIMALPIQELKSTIEMELEKNPALEVVEDNTVLSLDQAKTEADRGEEIDYFDNTSDPGFLRGPVNGSKDSKRKFIEGVLTRPESLHDHLIWQLRVQPISEVEFNIGELLIQNLDENGFHIEDPETLVGPEDLKVLKRVKKIVQIFDPVGTCTSGFRESLLVQIKNHPSPYPGSYEVVEKYLYLLERNKIKDIARRLHRKEEEIEKVKLFLKELDPLPGRNYSTEQPRYVIPDIRVRLQDGEFVIILNDETIPVLGVNPFFADISSNKERYQEKKLKNFVNSSLQEAKWFIRSIHQRNETLLKVCKAIIEFQRGFFREGPKKLVPLILKDIAGDIGVHEATVSRVTNGKYIQTEWGIFELKYFFSGAVAGSGPEGSNFSKQGVKQMVREIIESEPDRNHLTDRRITEILAGKGVILARRTVAKYRRELDILSSHHR